LLSEDFYPYTWSLEKWNNELLPVLNQKWAHDWPIVQRCIFYLINSGKPEQALDLIQKFQSRLSKENRNALPILFKLNLSAAIAAGNDEKVLSLTEKLIAISDTEDSGSSWGHYLKGRRLIDSGDFKAAADLLLPVLNTISLAYSPDEPTIKYIVDDLMEIWQADPTLIDSDKKALLDVIRVYLAKL
jgi:hypothetical protein